ncbi:phage tail length tape measure family protein [Rhizobium aethiopicum]|uniref:phage tail length tape measure family protein n=1 Tax=Rhizobium aethiopicum TaxID=1138170 RepID=UPI00160F040F|nr:phage tail length tape measure family protein [Rhizobium aethiopicum]
MAAGEATLYARMELRLNDAEKRLAKFQQTVDKSMAGVEGRFSKANDNIAKTFERSTGRITQSAGAQRAAVQNLSFQLNDIATSLAGGASPFTVMAQQGSQVAQVFQGSGGVIGAVQTLGGAFTQMVNPVALATFAIIGLGGAAVQYFSSMLTEGDKSAATLKEQADLIRAVAAEWGGAVPALKAYVDELDRAKNSGDLIKASDTLADQQWEVARKQVQDLNLDMAALVQDLRLAGAEDETILRLQNAFNAVSSSVKDGKENTAAMQEVQDSLAAAISQTGIPALDGFATAFGSLAGTIAGAARQAAVFRQEAIDALTVGKNGPKLGALSPLFSDNGKLYTQDQFEPGGEVPTPGANPSRDLSVTRDDIYGKPTKSSGGGGKSAAEREADAVKKLIEQLEFEQQTLGQTDQQRAVSNALRKAGSAATDEQKAHITELVTAIQSEKDALAKNKQAMQELQSVGKDLLGGFISDLRQGKSATEALSGVLDKLVDKMIDASLDSLFSGAFGGAVGKGGLLGGFLIPGILHSGGVAGSDGYGHGRAVSPKTFAGAKRYHTGGVAGLQPGEVPAILQRGEVVLPRGTKTSGGGKTQIQVGVSVDDTGGLRAYVKSVSQDTVTAASPRILSAANQQVVPTMAKYQNDSAGGDYRNG